MKQGQMRDIKTSGSCISDVVDYEKSAFLFSSPLFSQQLLLTSRQSTNQSYWYRAIHYSDLNRAENNPKLLRE